MSSSAAFAFAKTPITLSRCWESVRWARVNKYIQSFGYSGTVDKDDYIPENMFYRLAMKAKRLTDFRNGLPI